MPNELTIQLHQTTIDLLDAISLFTQEQFNTIPFEDSWTAAQVTEHLFKAETGVPKIWQGNTQLTKRVVDQNVEILKQVFLDFSTKLKSPEFILPSLADVIQDKEERYQSFKAKRAEIDGLAPNIDLSLTYTDFAFPNMGALTGIEWVVFLTAHATRHIRQLQNIHKVLTSTNP